MKKTDNDAVQLVVTCAADIINSYNMQLEKIFIQHGGVSCFEHSFAVSYMSIRIASRLNIAVDMRSMVRGAMLHDYFLYDWHDDDKSHRLHGFTHARSALANAERDFFLNGIERDIILKHMFPLNLAPPKHRESIIVSIADKLCAVYEIFFDMPMFFLMMAQALNLSDLKKSNELL